jgi:hypothetical protein
MDSALYTRRYQGTNFGAFYLPREVYWRVLPRYVGEDAEGNKIVDERITVVLQDEPNRFWPLIVKMSIEEAEHFQNELSKMIAEKKRGGE